jgi:hypothetical protein
MENNKFYWKVEKTCGICNNVFIPVSHHQKHCSLKCRVNHNINLNKYKYKHTCIVCMVEFKCSSFKQKYCSSKCATHDRNKHLYDGSKKKCSICGGFFDLSLFKTKKYNGKLRSNCPDCHKSKVNAKNYKRRNWLSYVRYDLDITKVFNYCDWKCSYCGIDTPKELRGKFVNNAPELDHIIPLSKGGSHTYNNVTLSCRKCNLSKTNKLNYATTGVRRVAISH